MPGDRLQWAYSVARIRALESHMIDKNIISRMLDAGDVIEAAKVLQETEWAPYVSSLANPDERDQSFTGELARIYQMVEDMIPDDWPVNILRARYDYHNLKVALKASLASRDPVPSALSQLGNVPAQTMLDSVRNNALTDLSEDLREAAESGRSAFAQTGRFGAVDAVVDSRMFHSLISRVPEPDGEFLAGYISRYADVVNIRALARARDMHLPVDAFASFLVPGGYIDKGKFLAAYTGPEEGMADVFQNTDYAKIPSITLKPQHGEARGIWRFERDSDDFLIEYLKGSKYVAFGPEPVIGYLLGKEHEVKLIRMLLVGKANGLPREAIRERLRDTYV
ncbi:MAG: hypothetical protein HPY52_03745 [Firmicutes bacterium]|nr:hypothetical protein [Bacillota bacterium]